MNVGQLYLAPRKIKKTFKKQKSNITYMLGNESVKEKSIYEHLGLTTFNSAKRIERTSGKFNKRLGNPVPSVGYWYRHMDESPIKLATLFFGLW